MSDLHELKPGDTFNPFGLFIGSFIPNAMMRFSGLSSSAKLVWSRLAQFAGRNGICFPSQKTLSEETGIGERQIRRLLRELESQGFIKVERPQGQNRMNHLSAHYTFLWHKIFSESCRSGADIYVRSIQDTDVRSYNKGIKENHSEENHKTYIQGKNGKSQKAASFKPEHGKFAGIGETFNV